MRQPVPAAHLKGRAMRYYVLEPEVAGNFGKHTIFVDQKARPPLVERFHYEFNIWLGDPILEAICCYIVTEPVRDKILSLDATGVSFGPVEVSTTYPLQRFHEIENFQSLHGFKLPAEQAKMILAIHQLTLWWSQSESLTFCEMQALSTVRLQISIPRR